MTTAMVLGGNDDGGYGWRCVGGDFGKRRWWLWVIVLDGVAVVFGSGDGSRRQRFSMAMGIEGNGMVAGEETVVGQSPAIVLGLRRPPAKVYRFNRFNQQTDIQPRTRRLVSDVSVLMLAVGLVITASFFILLNIELFVFLVCYIMTDIVHLCSYEATSSRKSRSLAKELVTGATASVFLGFGSLFLLLASGVYV
ncbi:hypothetical protein OSB04_015215 [Centaurea solstitialis]|uniref:Dolichyl-diphosphooligosaccharide-protein glycosyltransferase subunit OST5 n=1 Tax=Centaurea solstitialis TaxID=347529 RepID=A0AA38TAK0_9ASTR|nr:hypothetical protein OSB04_015215 [Centaurea solstitialis]